MDESFVQLEEGFFGGDPAVTHEAEAMKPSAFKQVKIFALRE